MTREEINSCIRTIETLKHLAYNVNGMMHVIDAENCNKIINALETDVSDTNQEPQGRLVEEKIHKIHVYYITNNTFGDATITQRSYIPITPEVLEDMKELIREKNGYSEETEIIIACWQRYES